MLNCAEQVQIQLYKTHAYNTCAEQVQIEGIRPRMVYLYYLSCLRYTILAGNPRNTKVQNTDLQTAHTEPHTLPQTECESPRTVVGGVGRGRLRPSVSSSAASCLGQDRGDVMIGSCWRKWANRKRNRCPVSLPNSLPVAPPTRHVAVLIVNASVAGGAKRVEREGVPGFGKPLSG